MSDRENEDPAGNAAGDPGTQSRAASGSASAPAAPAMAATAAAPAQGLAPRGRSTRFLLIGSLALNLLFVGFLVGGLVAGGHRGPGYPHGGPARPFHAAMGMGWAMHGLPEARREALRPTLQASFAQMRPQLRAMRDAQRDVAAALERDRFDRAELERALAAMQARMREMERTGHVALVEMAAQLTREERQQLARTLRAPPFPFRQRPGPGPGLRIQDHQAGTADSTDPAP